MNYDNPLFFTNLSSRLPSKMPPSRYLLSLLSLSFFPFSSLASTPLPMGGAMIVSRQDNSCPGYGDCDCNDWGMSCAMTDWSWFNCGLDGFAGSCNGPAPAAPSSAPPPPPPPPGPSSAAPTPLPAAPSSAVAGPLPSSWSDAYGPVPSGSFTSFILPRKWNPANTASQDTGLGLVSTLDLSVPSLKIVGGS